MARRKMIPLAFSLLGACFYQPTGSTTSEGSASVSGGPTGGTGSTDVATDTMTPLDTLSTTAPTNSTATPTTTDDSESSTGPDTTSSDITTVSDDDDTSPETSTDTSPTCGDGLQDGSEECDDGNAVKNDGCEPGCVFSAICGNGQIENGEVCDDGNTVDLDACSADCLIAAVERSCGNGMVESPETCDDGNKANGDGCDASCTLSAPECGNGKIEAGEGCDDGNIINGGPGDFCKNDCTLFVPASCQAPAEYVVCDDGVEIGDKSDKVNVPRAIGICNDQPGNSVQITEFLFSSKNDAAWQVAKGFGSYSFDHDTDAFTPDQLLYSPREGDTFLILSSGVIKPPNVQGIVTETPNSQGGHGDNGNEDNDLLPAPLQTGVGSNNGAGGTPFQQCDGVGDCSDTLFAQWSKGAGDPNDKLWFTFKTKVPSGTFGYSLDLVLCSSEWPDFVDTGYNDMFTVYQVDPSVDDPNMDPPVDPYTGNITFIDHPVDPKKGLPLSVTALDTYLAGQGYSHNEPQLTGTGFETHACTGWLRVKGGVQPGATVELGFLHADLGDSLRATVVLLDNFRWDCEGCVPSEVDDCGVQDL